MGKPLVSIIVPVYNMENYVCRCVDSILSQSYENIEILLINDGSKDKSGSIIIEHYSNEPRVVYIEKNNEGVSKTRNYGIEKAKGEYLAFVDADDWIASTFVEQAVNSLEQYNLDFVLGGTEKIYPSHSVSCIANTLKKIVIYQDDLNELIAKVLGNAVLENSVLNTCFTSGSVCKLFRRKIIDEVRFDERLIIGEDIVFNLMVIERSKRVGVVPDVWYYYRMNNESITKRYNPKIQDYTEQLLEILLQMYYDREQLKPYLCVRAVQQFHNMLILYPLDKASGMSFSEKRNYIKAALNKPVWDKLFQKDFAKDLPASKFDKLLMGLCVNKMSIAIIFLIESRLLIKHLMHE